MPAESSADILQRLHSYHPQVIDLSLREGYFRLLEKLGNPHKKLPPVVHVAGTNGKGSTIAFMRAMLEARGKRVHVYTSPHLVSFHERIRLAGKLIEEDFLVKLLLECEAANAKGQVTFFELTTAVAFSAFAQTPADVVLLETGMGGRLDSTNVIDQPALCVITDISTDHQEYLGDTLEKIAAEKAGIFKKDVIAIIAPQGHKEVLPVLEEKAAAVGAPLFIHDRGWRYALSGDGFTYLSSVFTQRFPQPSLVGDHQYANAATAIAAVTHLKDYSYSPESLVRGVREAYWPARLQPLKEGPLAKKLPEGFELWLDGGHNDSAGAALAIQARQWQEEDGKPLLLICGMLKTKQPREFLNPLAPHVKALAAVAIPEEPKTLNAQAMMEAALQVGIPSAETCVGLHEALDFCLNQTGGKPARILITGSLYLAGYILRDHY